MPETKKALSIDIPVKEGHPATITLITNQKAQTFVNSILSVGYNEGYMFITIQTNNSIYQDIPVPVQVQNNFMNGQIIQAGSNVSLNNGGYITISRIVGVSEKGIEVLDINNQSYTGYICPLA